MNLILDLGNSRDKVALFDAGEIKKLVAVRSLTGDRLRQFCKGMGVNAALVSSVTSEAKALIKGMQKDFKVFQMDEDLDLPIINVYHTPRTLGNDRLACAVAAAARFPKKNVLSIDAGTCIKYDFVDDRGRYQGGAISPGLQMRLKAMHTFTARLPLVKLSKTETLIGRSTQESILNGAVNGALQEVSEAIRCYKEKVPALKVILTGGDMEYFEERLKNRIFAVPNLVLHGLNLILEHNVKNQ